MVDYKRMARGEVNQPGWSGSVDDLGMLVKHFEEFAEYVRQVLEPQARAELEAEIADAKASNARYPDREEAYNERDIARLTRSYEEFLSDTTHIQMTVRQAKWGLELEGSPDVVMRDIDCDDVKRIDIELGRKPYNARYRARLTLSGGGAGAQFSGPDTKWIDLVATRLGRELQAQRPKFWWVRRWQGYLLTFAVTIPVVTAVVGWILPLGVGATFFVGGLVATGVSFGVRALLERLAPRFELYQPTPPKGSRSERQARSLGAVVWALVGVVVIPIALMVIQTILSSNG